MSRTIGSLLQDRLTVLGVPGYADSSQQQGGDQDQASFWPKSTPGDEVWAGNRLPDHLVEVLPADWKSEYAPLKEIPPEVQSNRQP